MTTLDHSRKRAAPPNPSRIRGDVCGLNGDLKMTTSSQDDPGPTVISIEGLLFILEPSSRLLMPAKEKSYKNAENHDVSVSGRGGQVLR